MSFAYDLILNFNNELYEFFEWKLTDEITRIKKINVICISSKIYNDILDNQIEISDEFLLSIYRKCEIYNNKSIETIPYAVIVTDNYRVMAIIINNDGKIIKYSSLLLDEEEELLNLSKKIHHTKLVYKIINRKPRNDFKTRYEKNIIKFIKKDLINSYQKRNINKLEYLYYEFFNKKSNDMKEILHDLINELDKDITENHLKIYNLIKLSYSHKTV